MSADNLPENLRQEYVTHTGKVIGVMVGSYHPDRGPSISLLWEDVGVFTDYPIKYPEQTSAFLDTVFYARQHDLTVTGFFSPSEGLLLTLGVEFDQ